MHCNPLIEYECLHIVRHIIGDVVYCHLADFVIKSLYLLAFGGRVKSGFIAPSNHTVKHLAVGDCGGIFRVVVNGENASLFA